MADHNILVELFLAKEGGLSRAKTDTASRNPAPCRITYKGSTHSDFHTNKGITWTTFKALAAGLGYTASCANFARMPKSIWLKIFKQGYWDPWNLDGAKHNAIAAVLVWWAWGSGNGGALKSLKKYLAKKGAQVSTRSAATKALMDLADRQGVERTFMELREHRLAFYRSLSTADKNYRGWKSSYDKFADWAKSNGHLKGGGGTSTGGSTGTGILAFAAIAAMGIFIKRKM